MRLSKLKFYFLVPFLMLNWVGLAQISNYYNDSYRGNFTIIGNTLTQDLAAGIPMPIVGSIGTSGTNTADSSGDVFWRSNSPLLGQAEANTSITDLNARSTSILKIPAGATVRKAVLYWSSKSSLQTPSVTLSREASFSEVINAENNFFVAPSFYGGRADITNIVLANGSGAYSVSGVNCLNLTNLNDSTAYSAWSIVVFYELPSDPFRNFQLKDGLVQINTLNPLNLSFSGFLIEGVGNSNLGIIAFEGDNGITGDMVKVDAMQLSNAMNPTDNFFNGTRSNLGSPVSVAGDLPQLTGDVNSMSGIDMDIVDVTSFFGVGKTSVNIEISTTNDGYFVGAAVLAVPVAEVLSLENELFSNMKIYPVPTHSDIAIEITEMHADQDMKYAIYDTNGRLLASERITNLKQLVSLDKFEKGTYLLEISNKEMKKVQKIIKK